MPPNGLSTVFAYKEGVQKVDYPFVPILILNQNICYEINY
jgi:hypothetical protein